MLAADHDIRWLDIAMDHPLLVCELKGVGNVGDHPGEFDGSDAIALSSRTPRAFSPSTTD